MNPECDKEDFTLSPKGLTRAQLMWLCLHQGGKGPQLWALGPAWTSVQGTGVLQAARNPSHRTGHRTAEPRVGRR